MPGREHARTSTHGLPVKVNLATEAENALKVTVRAVDELRRYQGQTDFYDERDAQNLLALALQMGEAGARLKELAERWLTAR